MRRFIICALATLFVLVGSIATAGAQEEAESDDARVVIVNFDTTDVDEAVMDQFYGRLRNVIADLDAMRVASGGNLSMNDLLLMVGCDSPSPECMAMAADFVDGDQLLYGSVQRSDDVHMFSIELFDFASGEVTKSVSDQTLRGDEQWLAEGIPAVIEYFAYGETASLQVDVSGADDAEVQINGNAVGTGSTLVEDLAPGEAVVSVTGPDGTEQQERLILRHDELSTVEFSVAPAVADLDGDGGAMGPTLVPGLAATGVGIAGLVVGLVGQSQLSGAESEANTLVGGRGAIDRESLSRAQQLQNDMDSANTLRVVGLSAGGVGLVAGGVLLGMAMMGDSPQGGDSDELAGGMERNLDLDFNASADGFGAGFRFKF